MANSGGVLFTGDFRMCSFFAGKRIITALLKWFLLPADFWGARSDIRPILQQLRTTLPIFLVWLCDQARVQLESQRLAISISLQPIL
jgi:hypothetical protein